MTTILQINSTARSQNSHSTQLASELTQKLAHENPGARVIVRDLLVTNLPHFNDDAIAAYFTPADQHTAAQKAVIAKGDALIAELTSSDIIVIGAPLYNFGISSQLKTYFDWVARAGATFRYGESGPVGMVTGKKAYVVTTRGGMHLGTARETQTPHIATFLGFIGITDVTFIYAEGLSMGEAAMDSGLANARQAISATA
jgi:FMN-dependent NADH-azoreductase